VLREDSRTRPAIHWSTGMPTGELAQEIGTSHSMISAIPFQLEKRHSTLSELLFFISHTAAKSLYASLC